MSTNYIHMCPHCNKEYHDCDCFDHADHLTTDDSKLTTVSPTVAIIIISIAILTALAVFASVIYIINPKPI